MMDFKAISEVLKNGSDQAIIAGMKSGSIPSQMAIAELQDRKKTRIASAGQPPQPNMQDQMDMNNPQGQQLPVAAPPQMNPAKTPGMSGGGIVAFKHGGEVKGYAGGGDVYGDDNPMGLTPDQLAQQAADRRKLMRLPSAAADIFYGAPNNAIADVYNGVANTIPRVGRAMGVNLPDQTNIQGLGDGSLAPFYNHYARDPEDAPTAATKPLYNSEATRQAAAARIASGEMGRMPQPQTPQFVPSAMPNNTSGIGSIGMRVKTGGGMGGTGNRDFNIPEFKMPDAPNYDKYRDNTTAESAGAEYDTNVGSNEAIAARAARLSDKEAALSRDSDRAPWLALMKAGLGMAASKNRNLFGAAGEGGIAGLNDYTTAQADINRRDDALFDRRSQVEDAQRADKLARFGFVHGESSKAEDRNNAIGIKQLDTGYQGSLEGIKLNAQRAEKIADLTQRQNSDELTHQYQMGSLQVQKAAANKKDMVEKFIDAQRSNPDYYKVDPATNKLSIFDYEKAYTAALQGKFMGALGANDQRDTASTRATLTKQLLAETDPIKQTMIQQQINALNGGTGPTRVSAPPTGQILD